ncbi:MAG: helix-turn-helix domain-containing protein [Blautia producta]|uniref:Helix-turn-helix domain-containing protein n=2 Tax=Blautia producta TaxID=33035 RepID=A0A7G5N1K9_9FIRM|nr:helix-turn-helix transcriptional regulator [Blautia producta]MDU5221911.1 helix-turn-helix domain-containing protein [Blautia producta]MDU5383432.1 helix-turn-helix domain-containing protein [Blautia producta]MDU6884663.1 helix-turn-helix domain-containing protein [Blautia producta]QIB56474.1 helix-turn-helix domain-containing protein [Blautia producta ATCC 27340 = DSM 2950]QMW80752.1 helix-turn-helix domain-containing protein [Blautia producta]
MGSVKLEEFVPDRINFLCNKYKITRYELSKRTGISQTALSNIVKHKQIPTLDTLEKICEGFQMSVVEFFTTPDNIAGLSEEEKKILRLWGNLSEEEKRFLEVILLNLDEHKKSGN